MAMSGMAVSVALVAPVSQMPTTIPPDALLDEDLTPLKDEDGTILQDK